MSKRRRRYRGNTVDKNYKELIPVLNKVGKASINRDAIVLETEDLVSTWFKLEDLCEEIVVGDFQSEDVDREYNVIELFCIAKKVKVVIKSRNLPNLLALTPVFLILDKKACIRSLREQVSVF